MSTCKINPKTKRCGKQKRHTDNANACKVNANGRCETKKPITTKSAKKPVKKTKTKKVTKKTTNKVAKTKIDKYALNVNPTNPKLIKLINLMNKYRQLQKTIYTKLEATIDELDVNNYNALLENFDGYIEDLENLNEIL
jgi:hypothetical protein